MDPKHSDETAHAPRPRMALISRELMASCRAVSIEEHSGYKAIVVAGMSTALKISLVSERIEEIS